MISIQPQQLQPLNYTFKSIEATNTTLVKQCLEYIIPMSIKNGIGNTAVTKMLLKRVRRVRFATSSSETYCGVSNNTTYNDNFVDFFCKVCEHNMRFYILIYSNEYMYINDISISRDSILIQYTYIFDYYKNIIYINRTYFMFRFFLSIHNTVF